MTTLEAAHHYHDLNIRVIPLPYRSKRPVIEDWPHLEIAREDFARYFNGDRQNIGAVLGPGGLTDLDLDAPETLVVAPQFALPTNMVFGRRSKPRSHWFYIVTEGELLSERLTDPAAATEQKGTLLELRSLKRDGSIGMQTVVPPSTHAETGEAIEFDYRGAGAPSVVARADQITTAHRIAACAMLARHAPAAGARHDFFLAIAGALAHAKWPLEHARKMLRAIYRVLWGPQAAFGAAEKEAESTYQRYDDGHEITGLGKLEEMLDSRVFGRLVEWLGLERGDRSRTAERPRVVLPTPEKLKELRNRILPISEPIVDGILLSPGLTLVSAAPKAGKTIFSVQLAFSVASRRPLFDYFSTTKQLGVLILEWDDPQGDAALKAFVERYPGRDNQPAVDEGPLYFCSRPKPMLTLSDPLFLPWLKAQIEQYSIGVVVLDSYTALRGLRSGQDVVKLEAHEMTLLADLASELRIAIVLIHHDSKSSAHLDWSSRTAGSFAVGAAVDTLIRLSRFDDLDEGDGARLVQIRGRHLAGKTMVLRFREASLDFDLIYEGPVASLYPELKLLHDQFRGVAFTIKDVTSKTGWATSTGYNYLRKLTRAGILKKTDAVTTEGGKKESGWDWDPSIARMNL
jgi:hypothetical protein